MKKLEQDLEQLKQDEKKTQVMYDNCVSTVSTLEKSITDHGSHREKRLNDLNTSIKKLKAELQSSSVLLKVFIRECFFFFNLPIFAPISRWVFCMFLTSQFNALSQIFR